MDIKHQRGLYSEMLAAAELTRQGYEVLFNMADNGLVDIVALNTDTGEVKLYDVKTKSYRKDGSMIHRVPRPSQRKIGVEIYYVDRFDMEDLNEDSNAGC